MYTVPLVAPVVAFARAAGSTQVVDVVTPVAIFVQLELFKLYCNVWVNAVDALDAVEMVTVFPTFHVPLVVGVVALGIVVSVAEI